MSVRNVVAVLACVSGLSACAGGYPGGPVSDGNMAGGPVVADAGSTAGSDMQADLSACSAAARSEGSSYAASSFMNGVINAAVGAVAYGRVSPYSVTSVTRQGTNAAFQADRMSRARTDACMRRAGWKVY